MQITRLVIRGYHDNQWEPLERTTWPIPSKTGRENSGIMIGWRYAPAISFRYKSKWKLLTSAMKLRIIGWRYPLDITGNNSWSEVPTMNYHLIFKFNIVHWASHFHLNLYRKSDSRACRKSIKAALDRYRSELLSVGNPWWSEEYWRRPIILYCYHIWCYRVVITTRPW